MRTCPICDKDFETKRDYDSRSLLEERGECTDEYHRYGYEYAYGSYREVVGSVEFVSDYLTPGNVIRVLDKQYAAVIALEKEFYKTKVRERKTI